MQFNHHIYRISILLLLILPGQSSAFGESYSFGIGVGQTSYGLKESNIIANDSGLSANSSFTDSSTTLLIAGSARLDQYLSLNLEVFEQGDIKAAESGIEKKLFDVSTIAFTVSMINDFNERYSGYARLGVHLWDASAGSDFTDSVDGSVDLTYGLGLDINVYGGKERLLRIQWDHFDYDGVFLDKSDVVTISLQFLFGN